MSEPMLALVGPTGTGKSALALGLAERLGGEILSCDSVQVYRGFDIGSAKPTVAERERVAHHCLDVAEPTAPFDAAAYSRMALTACEDMRARGKRPILCGGTGMYLRTLRWGLLDVPSGPPELRAQLEADARTNLPGLYERLAHLDPVGARAIDPRNPAHVVRALEICLLTGEPASTVRARHGFATERVPMRVLVLDRPDADLRARIRRRVRAMLRAGLLEETRAHLERGVPVSARPLGSVGYRECVAVLEGKLDEAMLEAVIGKSTWAYVRRQRTWFRKERNVQHVVLDPADDVASEVTRVLRLLTS